MTKESLRNEHGAEYWSARDLQPLLGYGQWRRFEDAIKRAVTSCKQSGNEPGHHFANTGKMIEIGKGGIFCFVLLDSFPYTVIDFLSTRQNVKCPTSDGIAVSSEKIDIDYFDESI